MDRVGKKIRLKVPKILSVEAVLVGLKMNRLKLLAC